MYSTTKGVKAPFVASLGTEIELLILTMYVPTFVFVLMYGTVKSKVLVFEVANTGTPVIESV